MFGSARQLSWALSFERRPLKSLHQTHFGACPWSAQSLEILLLVPSSIFLSWSDSKSYHFWHPRAAAQPIWSAQNHFWCKAQFSAWLYLPKFCASKVFFCRVVPGLGTRSAGYQGVCSKQSLFVLARQIQAFLEVWRQVINSSVLAFFFTLCGNCVALCGIRNHTNGRRCDGGMHMHLQQPVQNIDNNTLNTNMHTHTFF